MNGSEPDLGGALEEKEISGGGVGEDDFEEFRDGKGSLSCSWADPF